MGHRAIAGSLNELGVSDPKSFGASPAAARPSVSAGRSAGGTNSAMPWFVAAAVIVVVIYYLSEQRYKPSVPAAVVAAEAFTEPRPVPAPTHPAIAAKPVSSTASKKPARTHKVAPEDVQEPADPTAVVDQPPVSQAADLETLRRLRERM